jgi:nucleoside-triphosphatase THEP1
LNRRLIHHDDTAVAEGLARVAAVVYANEIYPDAVFSTLVTRGRAMGLRLAGVVQHRAFVGGDRRCDVVLEDLATGHRTALFENRGAGARGCLLDQAALAEATARVEGSLEHAPQLLILNKFGKVECEGSGLRALIASAIDRGIPVIIAVPKRNLDAWQSFAGEFAIELPDNANQIAVWLERVVAASPGLQSENENRAALMDTEIGCFMKPEQ